MDMHLGCNNFLTAAGFLPQNVVAKKLHENIAVFGLGLQSEEESGTLSTQYLDDHISLVTDSMYRLPASRKVWPMPDVDHGDFLARKSHPDSITMPGEERRSYDYKWP